jgi:hypothetical protein
MKMKPENPKPSIKPGPKPEVLTIPGKWEDAVKTSLGKKKPVGGWPK